ncbi:MAG: hypothetical protein ABI905_09365 [Betaproteobacteria bacterium]
MHDLAVSNAPIPILWKTSDVESKRALSIRRLYIIIGLSVLFHALLFIFVPHRAETGTEAAATAQGPLVVRLTPPKTSPVESPPPAAQEAPAQPAAPHRRPPPPAPNIMSVPRASTSAPSVPLQQPVTPVPTVPPKDNEPPSMMAMVDAARARRQASEDAVKRYNAEMRGAENPTGDDIAAANLKRNLQNLSGRGGTSGVFQILQKGHRSGQFAFRGWTNDSSNDFKQVIDVDAGPTGDLELAMVRRMIDLIREHYKGNFNWESHRLGRVVVLSARQEDSAGLEGFLIKEFFGLGR